MQLRIRCILHQSHQACFACQAAASPLQRETSACHLSNFFFFWEPLAGAALVAVTLASSKAVAVVTLASSKAVVVVTLASREAVAVVTLASREALVGCDAGKQRSSCGYDFDGSEALVLVTLASSEAMV